MSERPPEPPAWLGQSMAVAGCVGLVVIGLAAGGQARVWLILAASCLLVGVALEAGWT